MKKICFVVSSPMYAVAFLAPHFLALQSDHDLNVAENTPDTGLLRRLGVDVDIDPVPIERAIRPLRDLLALWNLYRLFRRQHFDAVHSVTPKAGLLAKLAAWLARVPVPVHWFTRQVWATKTGLGHWGLAAEGVVDGARAEVLAGGSVCGVDGARFRPDAGARSVVSGELGIPDSAVLLLYLGRLNRYESIPAAGRSVARSCVHARFMGKTCRMPR
jgi:hypothetical protein